MQQILTWLCFAAVMMRELESGMRKCSALVQTRYRDRSARACCRSRRLTKREAEVVGEALRRTDDSVFSFHFVLRAACDRFRGAGAGFRFLDSNTLEFQGALWVRQAH